MAEQILVQFRVDKELRNEVAAIYEAMGINLNSALRMFMVKSREMRDFPFDTKVTEKAVSRKMGLDAFEELRRQAADVPEMTLEEINEEIREARRGRKQ